MKFHHNIIFTLIAFLLILQGCRKTESRAVQAPQNEVVKFIIEENGGKKYVFSEDTSQWTSGAVRLNHTASYEGEDYNVIIRYLGSNRTLDLYDVKLSGTVFGGNSSGVRSIGSFDELLPDGFPVSPQEKVSVRIKVRKNEPNQ